jgi:hypothetical protein
MLKLKFIHGKKHNLSQIKRRMKCLNRWLEVRKKLNYFFYVS